MEEKETLIKLETISDVNDLCSLANKNTGDVLLVSGRYIVSAKSLMGIMSLNLSNPIKLIAEGDINKEFANGIKKFIVG